MTYPINGLAHLVNESREDARAAGRYRAWSVQPGDIVRHQLFPEDRDRPASDFPVGIVVWCSREGFPYDRDVVGVLWSGDPNR